MCIKCRQAVFLQEAASAERPGHVYSAAGRREFLISGFCEFCFDGLFAKDDEDEG